MASATGDRNLLFGILALQMDFISRDALVQAMHAWVLDKAKPLGQILVEHQVLGGERRALLEALVQEHLKQHGDDAEKSLASVSSVGSVREELQQIADPDVQASLARIHGTRPVEADPYATNPPSVAAPSTVGRRFRVLRPHAEGGLGKVSVARDEELHREVALKEIQERHADHPASRARFLVEAEITGGLEHPGIVPVYGLGTYADGRPFYAMRFIKGDSLKDAIERFHRTASRERKRPERALELRQLLGRFNDVCDAISYAHSRGVLHRDLKPGNVMLGKYGETLVVDWGLAKPVGGPAGKEGEAEEALRPASSAGSAPTQVGQAVGTPAFMSPEQAAGRLDQLGAASDVYSLGATLYCLLTGKAPFEGGNLGEVLQKVQRGDFPRPRQVKRDVPRALEAVCLKAMALRSEDRYVTPRALADDVERWLADEPTTAYREPWRTRMSRWARRRRTLVASFAAGLVVAVVAAGAAAWWLERQAVEQRQAVESALAVVVRLMGESRWDEAQTVLDQARRRLGNGGPREVQAKLDRTQSELELVQRLDAVRLRRAALVQGRLDLAGVDRGYEDALRQAGMPGVGGDAAAAASWVNNSAVREALLAAFDDWAVCAEQQERRSWVLEVARRADPDPWRDRARDPAVWDDVAALVRLAKEEAASQSPQLCAALGMRLVHLHVRGEAEPLLRAMQEQLPGDFWLNCYLGNALMADHEPQEALGYFRAALAVRPRTSIVYFDLGNALQHQGKLEDAAAEFRKAIQLDPKDALSHNNLGSDLYSERKLEEAGSEFRTAIALDPKDAMQHLNLGNVLRDQGKLEDAAAAFRSAFELDPKYADAHNNLGSVLRRQGELEKAAAEYRAAIALDPKYALPHGNLGIMRLEQGAFSEARQALQHCLELLPPDDPNRKVISEQLQRCERMLALDQKLPAILRGDAKPSDAAEQVGLAELCSLKKRHAAAARFYADAFAAEPALEDPSKAPHRYNAACAAALAAAGQGEDADKLDDNERARLRKQALGWLRDDLAAWGKLAENSPPQARTTVQQTLRHWQEDSDLASVRNKDALDKLPESERADWQKFWSDVDALVKKTNGSGQK